MPHKGELTNVMLAGGHVIIVRERMVAWEVAARGDFGRSKTGPTGQQCRPCLRTRRVKYLGAPGDVRRKLIGVVQIVMLIGKTLGVVLVQRPTGDAVET